MTTQVLEDMSLEQQEIRELSDLLFMAGIGSRGISLRQGVEIALTKIHNLEVHSNNLLACAYALNECGAPPATSVAERIRQKFISMSQDIRVRDQEISELKMDIQELESLLRIKEVLFSLKYGKLYAGMIVLSDLLDYYEERLDGKRAPLRHSVVTTTADTEKYKASLTAVIEKVHTHRDGYLCGYDIRLVHDNTLVEKVPPSHVCLLSDR